MIRKLVKPLWILLALLFLLEAWLWDVMVPPVARLIGLIPWQRLKAWLSQRIETMPPAAVLVLFALPDAVLLPIKLGALWLAAQGTFAGHALIGMGLFIAAKMIGLALTVFLFDLCRPKLMELQWFRWLYDWVQRARLWSAAQVAPIREEIRQRVALIKARLAPSRASLLRMAERLRSKIRRDQFKG